MKLTKKVLAVGLSALLVLPMALPAMAEEPSPDDALAASKTALTYAVNREINYAAYVESTTAEFKEKVAAAKAVLQKDDATKEDVDAALAAMKEAKKVLEYVDGVAGAFAVDNTDAKMQTNSKKAITTDWTEADITPIDLSKSDLSKVRLTFTLTLGNESEHPDANVFKTGHIELKSTDTTDPKDATKVVDNSVFFNIEKSLPGLKKGENKVDLVLADFDGAINKINWSDVQKMRMYIDSNNQYDGTFSMQLSDIRIIDETPADYVPEQGVVITFKDNKTYEYKGNNATDLPTDWVTSTEVDIHDKDLSNVFLKVDFTLTNTTGRPDAEVFKSGFFRLRSADSAATESSSGENNVGASIATLISNGTIQQPAAGKNSVKIPLTAFTDHKGTMDWATLNRFRMYFDGIANGIEAGKLTLKFDSIRVVDENVELEEGVLGVFKDDTTHESADKLLQTGWIAAGKPIDASKHLNNSFLHVKFTLSGGNADAFKTGYFRLRSTDDPGTEPPAGENNVGYSIANLKTPLKANDVNDLMIPLNSFDDTKGTMDWSKVEQFRVYINLPEGTPAATLKFETIEIIDNSVNTDPTVVGMFTQAQGKYDAAEKKVLQTAWVDADAAFDVFESDKDESYLHLKLNLTNGSDVADTEAFKSGKILLASANTDASKSDTNKEGENSVMVDISKLETPLTSGSQEVKIPLSAFAVEKGSIDWRNVTKFRMFIDSTDQLDAATSMTIELVEVVDPSQGGDTPDPDPDDYTLGDVDDNGEINASDALLVLQAATNKADLSDTQKLAADVDGKDGVTATDALLILQHSTKKINEFPAAK